MTWALRQRLIILGVGGSIVLLFTLGVVWVSFTGAPSCTDRKLNQQEEGIDCGGPCSKLCTETSLAPNIVFARSIKQGNHTDLIAHVENKTPSAGSARATFSIQGFSGNGTLLVDKKVSLPLPATPLIPLYVPNIFMGEDSVVRTFVALIESEPFIRTTPLIAPKVSSYTFSVVRESPRLNATVLYQGANTLFDVPLVATVFQGDEAVAVSRTIIPVLRKDTETDIVFTWEDMFLYEGARVVILQGTVL